MAEELKDNFSALYEVAQVINSILNPVELLDKVLEVATVHLSAERAFLLLADAKVPAGFSVVASRNFQNNDGARELAASSSVVSRVLTTGEPVLSFDALSDQRFEASTSIILQKILSIVCIPLHHRDRLIGAVYLDSTKSRRAFTEEAVKFLTVFGGLSAIAIENAQRFADLQEENKRLRNEVVPASMFKGVVGRSKPWQSVLELVKKVLDVDISVLITGESGTGKDVIARAIHAGGARVSEPFVSVNCSAIPGQLLESELFGHTKGAFTGANAEKKGLIESAHKGTLFLDEIADLTTELQAKILHVLQQKVIRRIGEVKDRKVDVRIIAATNKDLQEEITQGRFREDLFYRLNVVTIHLPPLRERTEDIPLLAEHFFKKASDTHKRKVRRISPEAMQYLVSNRWGGNVRELENVIERGVVLSSGDELRREDLVGGMKNVPPSLDCTLDDFEREMVQMTLNRVGGNRKQASERLGVSLRWLQYKLKEWKIG
ncbi:MAG TPA: sigma-54-dependent Fis family transcriptional regulator [Bacteroidota bacterium]|nr:sigma-54-dependent Fis family transcriptional regulator [Bacteroidota bacterium]